MLDLSVLRIEKNPAPTGRMSPTLLGEERDLAGAALPWMAKLRERALARARALGLPTRRDEDWRNTDLSALAAHPWRRPPPRPLPADLPLIAAAHRLVFLDGRPVDDGLAQPPLPAGVVLTTLSRALAQDPISLARWLARHPERGEHAFFDLNTALMQDGLVLRLPEGVVLEHPVQLISVSTGGEGASWLRHLVVLEDGAAVELVEDRIALGEGPDLHDAVTRISLGEEAELLHSRLVAAGPASYDLDLIHAEQGARSVLHHRSVAVGGALGRTELRVSQLGEGAEVQLSGLALGCEAQVLDFLTHVDHQAPQGVSRQTFRAVLTDQARSVFNGLVRVAQDAQGIDADQSSRALLLSETASAHHRPQLEILADDVRCTHGAAIGQLDEDALFYLRTRGLDERTARRLLLTAFTAELTDLLPEGNVQERARRLVESWLAAVGEAQP